MQEAAGLQRGGQHLHHRGVAVALVAGHLLANPAQGGQGGLAGVECLEDRRAVGHGLAVGADHHAGRGIHAAPGVVFDAAALGDGGGAVQLEGEILIRREAHRQRVGAQHVFHAEGGGNGGPGVGARHADHAGVGRHRGPVTRDAVVGRVSDSHHRQAKILCLFDGHLHGPMAGHHAHAVIGIQHGGGGRFLQDIDPGDRVLNARLDAVYIDGLEAVAAVAFNAPAVAFQQYIRADGGFVPRHAVAREGVGQKSVHQLP